MIEPVEQRVRKFWTANGVLPRSGVATADLRACEQRIGRALPPDVARFYECINGTEETAEWLFEVWPIERIGAVPEVVTPFAGIPDYSEIAKRLPNAEEYFAFADCMIWSHVFAVRLGASSTPTQVVWLCGDSYAVLAPTFGAFWERYLDDAESMLFARQAVIDSPAR